MSFPGNEGNEVFLGVFNYTRSVHLNLKKRLFFLITITTATEGNAMVKVIPTFSLIEIL